MEVGRDGESLFVFSIIEFSEAREGCLFIKLLDAKNDVGLGGDGGDELGVSADESDMFTSIELIAFVLFGDGMDKSRAKREFEAEFVFCIFVKLLLLLDGELFMWDEVFLGDKCWFSLIFEDRETFDWMAIGSEFVNSVDVGWKLVWVVVDDEQESIWKDDGDDLEKTPLLLLLLLLLLPGVLDFWASSIELVVLVRTGALLLMIDDWGFLLIFSGCGVWHLFESSSSEDKEIIESLGLDGWMSSKCWSLFLEEIEFFLLKK